MSINLQKQPPQGAAYTSQYEIGEVVWHAKGVYCIPIEFMILSVRFQYNAYGKLIAYYSYDLDSRLWYEESELFPTEQECINSI